MSASAAGSNGWLIVGANVFDGSGSACRRADVLVDGDRIVRVADHIESKDYPNVDVIDGSGQTLMPGMVDGHAHFGSGSTVTHNASGKEPHEEKVLLIAHAGETMLQHGFTSAYLGGDRNPAAVVALRKGVEEGWMHGPRLRVASWESTTLSIMDPTHALHTDRASVADHLYRWVHDMADIGVDIVKMPLTGESGLGPWNKSAENTSRDLIYSEEEVASAAKAAQERGLWLTAHAHSSEGIQMALRHGFRAIYHVSFADDAAIEALAKAKDQVFVAPSPGILYGLLHDETYPPTEGMETQETIESLRNVVPKMHQAGIRLVPGGDYGFNVAPIGENARDLELFVEWFGMTPAEALRCATEYGGFAMNMQHELGLVREGYLADMLLVDGEPTENVAILQDPERLTLIMQGGLPYKMDSRRLRTSYDHVGGSG
ncbi:amidohydrolase family protein [Amycolatopsis pigmentata]|uniref:Amidohydrolase family protein n=1 Tax=Amycolatopsis pigmentata TaxID=450801 RepID=A0ABW5FLK5_9PSEU